MSMLETRCVKVLTNTYKVKYMKLIAQEVKDMKTRIANKEPLEFTRNIIYVIDPDDVKIWYGLIFNVVTDDKEFDGGEYIIQLKASNDYPQKPPVFIMLTPNGVYNNNKAPCINIGHYHSNNYQCTLGMPGFGSAVAESMRAHKDLESGVSIIKTTTKQKQKLAKKSIKYNRDNHGDIMDMFKTHFEENELDIIAPNLSISNNLAKTMQSMSIN